jgi:hypothetical protein
LSWPGGGVEAAEVEAAEGVEEVEKEFSKPPDLVVPDLPLPPQPRAVTARADRIKVSSRPDRRGVIDELILQSRSFRPRAPFRVAPTHRKPEYRRFPAFGNRPNVCAMSLRARLIENQ